MFKLLLVCLLVLVTCNNVNCQVNRKIGYMYSVFAFDDQGTAYSFIYDGILNSTNSSIIRSQRPVASNNKVTWEVQRVGTLCWPSQTVLACVSRHLASGELDFSVVNVVSADGPITLLGGIQVIMTLHTGKGTIALSFVYDADPTTAYIAVLEFYPFLRELETINATNSFQVPQPWTNEMDLNMFGRHVNNETTMLLVYEQGGVLFGAEILYDPLFVDFNMTIDDEIAARESFELRRNVSLTSATDSLITTPEIVLRDGDFTLFTDNSTTSAVVLGQVENNARLYTFAMSVYLTAYYEPFPESPSGNGLAVDDSIYYLIIIVGVIMPGGCFMWSMYKCCCGRGRKNCCFYLWCFPFQCWAWAGACASHSLTTFFVAPMITKKCDGFNFAMKSWAFVYEALSDMLVTLVSYYIFGDVVNDFVLVLICSIIGFALRVPIKIMLFFFMRRYKDENSIKSRPCHWWLWLPCVCITVATIAPWITFLVLLESDLPQILLIWAITQGLMLAIEWQVKYVVFVFEGRDLTRNSISAMRYSGEDVETKSGCATCMFIFLAFFSGAQIADSVGPVGDAVLEKAANCC